MVNVPSLLVTVRIALPMFASTRKAAPHAVPWRNVAASLVWRGPQKDGVVSLFARRHNPVMAVINAGEGLEGQFSSGFHVDTAILRFSSTLYSWPTICCARKRRRRRTRRGKETGDTLAAVNFVYVLAGTDFFEGFSVYTSPFLSLIPTVFVSDLVWGWFLCGRAVSNGSVRLKSFSHSAASCSRL